MSGKTEFSTDDQLARYILERNRIRADNTVKPDAFVPYPWPNLSVTQHRGLKEEEIWEIGSRVAAAQTKPLYGRADFSAQIATKLGLNIVPDPVDGNPNHLNITGWPASKPEQKSIAQSIAAEAVYKARP